MPYVPLREVRDHVAQRKEFKGNNIFARKLGGAFDRKGEQIYAVFSYRYDWPLLIHAAGLWFENQDRFSRTTSKHHAYAKPYYIETRKLSVDAMNDLLNPHTQSGSVLRMLAAAAQETNHA